MAKSKSNKKYLLLLLPIVILILLFEIIPILSIIYNSFKVEEGVGFTFNNFLKIFSNDYYMKSIKNSIYISIVSSFFGIVIAFFASYSIYMATSSKIKTYFINLLNLTSNFAGVQLAFAFIILLGNSGMLVLLGKKYGVPFLGSYELYSTSGMLIVFIFFQIPLGSLLLYPSFSIIKQEYIEVSSLLNVSKLKFWIHIGIKLLLPSLIGTFSVLFANALSAYATPYALLGNNFALLPIKISNMFTGDIVQQKELGSVLSLVMIFLMVLSTSISAKLLGNKKKVR